MKVKEEQPKLFRCKTCFKEFRYLARYKAHVHNKHEKLASALHLCDKCPKAYIHGRSLAKHQAKSHGEFECDECDVISMSQADESKHRKKHHQENFKCKSCEDIFDAREKLRQHTKCKHRGKKYRSVTCLQCKIKYSNQDSYRVHVKKHHSPAEDVDIEDTEESLISL